MTLKEEMMNKINEIVLQMLDERYSHRKIAQKTGYTLDRISQLRKQQLSRLIDMTESEQI